MSESPTARTVAASQSERAEIIFPGDANPFGNLFGGRLLQFIDLVGALAATRHARGIPVTVSMDHIDFVAPVKVGDILILKASVNRAFNTSMEVGVKAMVENVATQTHHHVASAYLTFIALDHSGQRVDVPQILPETDHQRRRYEDAGRRRQMNSPEMARKKELRASQSPEWHV
jgi:acyl-CoA hydrolase